MTLLRARAAPEQRVAGSAEGRVTNIELFFDLVFAFAVTQLSHTLLRDPSLAGIAWTLLLFLAVWWVWICTGWVTNWLQPDRTPVRLMLLALMLPGVGLAVSLPAAAGAGGWGFALAYTAMQVGRSVFMLWALGGDSPANTRNFQRITAWLSLSGAIWLGGAALVGEPRLAAWALAAAVDYAAPAVGFWTPGLGCSTTRDWNVEGGHLAERCAQFVLLALGESLLVSGAAAAEGGVTPLHAAGFLADFTGIAAMWWVYFDTGAERGSAHIARARDPGRVARLAYTYLHMPIVAGIIAVAVADDLVLHTPLGRADGAAAALLLGGPALYLAGNLAFKAVIAGRAPLSHMVGLALLALLAGGAAHLPMLAACAAASLALAIVAAWETISLRRRR